MEATIDARSRPIAVRIASDLRKLSVLLCAFTSVCGQAAALNPDRSLTQYMHDAWTPRDGSPFSFVHAIAQTPDGYLWIGTTSEGLYRFDGARFVRDIDLDRAFGRTENTVYDVVADKNDLWVATPHGVARRTRGRWKVVLEQLYVTDLAATGDGELLAASPRRGLIRWRDGRARTVRIPGHCMRVCRGRDGEVWTGTPDSGLWRIDGSGITTMTRESGEAQIRVAALHLARNGDLWVGTRGGLHRVRHGRVADSITRSDGLPSDDVTAIFEDKNGAVWIGTGTDGIARLWQGRVESFGKSDGLPDDSVAAFYEDQEGSLWIATKGGLSRFKEGRFSPFGVPEGLGHDKVVSIIEGRDGSIWIWSDGGGLGRVKNGRVRVYTTRDGLASNFGGPLFEDRAGGVWIGHDQGASRIQDGRVTAFKQGPLGKSYVPFFAEDAHGLLTYVFGMGLARLQEGRVTPLRIESFQPGDDMSLGDLPMPFMARQTRDGTLWLGMNNGAWTLRDGVLKRVWRVPGRLPMVVWIHEDDEGAVWLATWEGLHRLKDGKAGVIAARHGLPHDRLSHIIEDQQGYFWLSSPRGIVRVKRRDLEDVAEGRCLNVETDFYDVADGMRSPQSLAEAQPCGCAARDGRLWFATSAGAVVVDPADTRRNTLVPAVVIEDLVADGKSRGASSGIRLDVGTKRLEVHYTAPSLLAPEKVRFKYRLEGFDRDWIDARRRTAYYTRLPPGEYRFHVIAANNDGVWNEVGASLKFRQLPHFHETIWFYLILVTALALTTIVVYRLRMRQHVRAKIELQACVQEALTHIKTLHGLLPICAWCNRIRDEQGNWRRLEEYVSEHTEAEFSHGICSECKEKHYKRYLERDSKS
ncbi:MAG: hypothetical protein JXO72_03880 [Vicinamibacteria bacterium]|nr:hypothetical protein [Vicinamibacteria bacterium]